MSNVKDTIDATKGLLEAVPIYVDMLQPAAKELGSGLLTIAKTVNLALSPLSGLIWGYEKISQYLTNDMATKLKDVPEERITTPDPSIAVPSIEAMRYSSLREMFSNLIATAMDKEVLLQAHPSFVEIIKQLSPDEAKIIQSIPNNGLYPLLGVRSVDEENRFYEIKKNFSDLPYKVGCSNPEMVSSYIENLNRLGLISIDTSTLVADNNYYENLIRSPEIQAIIPSITNQSRKVEYRKYAFSVTEFGGKFVQACCRS